MHNEELYDEIDNSQTFTEKHLGLSLSKFFSLVLLVLVSGVYRYKKENKEGSYSFYLY